LLGYKDCNFPHHHSLQDLYFDNTAIFSLQYQIPQLEKAEKLIVQKSKGTSFEITGLKYVLGGSLTYLVTVNIYRLPMTQGLAEFCYRKVTYYHSSAVCHLFHTMPVAAKR